MAPLGVMTSGRIPSALLAGRKADEYSPCSFRVATINWMLEYENSLYQSPKMSAERVRYCRLRKELEM